MPGKRFACPWVWRRSLAAMFRWTGGISLNFSTIMSYPVPGRIHAVVSHFLGQVPRYLRLRFRSKADEAPGSPAVRMVYQDTEPARRTEAFHCGLYGTICGNSKQLQGNSCLCVSKDMQHHEHHATLQCQAPTEKSAVEVWGCCWHLEIMASMLHVQRGIWLPNLSMLPFMADVLFLVGWLFHWSGFLQCACSIRFPGLKTFETLDSVISYTVGLCRLVLFGQWAVTRCYFFEFKRRWDERTVHWKAWRDVSNAWMMTLGPVLKNGVLSVKYAWCWYHLQNNHFLMPHSTKFTILLRGELTKARHAVNATFSSCLPHDKLYVNPCDLTMQSFAASTKWTSAWWSTVFLRPANQWTPASWSPLLLSFV